MSVCSETPLYPLTSQMLPFLRFGMLATYPADRPLVLRRIDPSRTRIRHWRDHQRVAFPRLAHDPFEDRGAVPGGQRADARGGAHLDGAAGSGRLHQLRAGPVSAIRIHLQRYLLLHAVHPGRGHSGDLAEQMAGHAADAGRLHRPAEPGTDGLRPCALQLQPSPMPSTPT